MRLTFDKVLKAIWGQKNSESFAQYAIQKRKRALTTLLAMIFSVSVNWAYSQEESPYTFLLQVTNYDTAEYQVSWSNGIIFDYAAGQSYTAGVEELDFFSLALARSGCVEKRFAPKASAADHADAGDEYALHRGGL